MNILVLGSGGREHALIKKLSESPRVTHLFCAPGNDGMADVCECVPIPVTDIHGLARFATTTAIDLTIVGPELPLTMGIVDAFQKASLKIFGPSQRASELEGSKVFMKDFCKRHHIPTAAYATFNDAEAAKEYLGHQKFPVVIKADGLAAGKGVVIAANQAEAFDAINEIMVQHRHPSTHSPMANSLRAGGEDPWSKIVIEEFLTGEEASFIVVTDGKDFVEFPASQDHKKIFDGDLGPNTGGMGAYAPAPVVTPDIRQKTIDRIILPTLKGMINEGRLYTGFLYAGLMISPAGDPILLEYNCRLGDPETEVLLPLLDCDLVDLIEAALNGTLKDFKISLKQKSAVCVVLASQGYPGEYRKGDRILGLDTIADPAVFVYHAGTKKDGDHFVTNGGRVLVVSAVADSLLLAIEKAYENVRKITWDGVQWRGDIGRKIKN